MVVYLIGVEINFVKFKCYKKTYILGKITNYFRMPV